MTDNSENSHEPKDSSSADNEMVQDLESAFADLNIIEVVKERDEFKDIALRIQADFENFRKRTATQLADEVDRATGRIVESLLPVLDACEAATSHGVTGVEQVWSSLLSAVQKHGLEALDLAGKPFDPAVAEAVMHEEGDPEDSASEPMVVEVLRTGYRWKGRVLRAAMVKVKG